MHIAVVSYCRPPLFNPLPPQPYRFPIEVRSFNLKKKHKSHHAYLGTLLRIICSSSDKMKMVRISPNLWRSAASGPPKAFLAHIIVQEAYQKQACQASTKRIEFPGTSRASSDMVLMQRVRFWTLPNCRYQIIQLLVFRPITPLSLGRQFQTSMSISTLQLGLGSNVWAHCCFKSLIHEYRSRVAPRCVRFKEIVSCFIIISLFISQLQSQVLEDITRKTSPCMIRVANTNSYERSSTTLPCILPSDISLNTSVKFSIFSIRIRVLMMPRAAISSTSNASRWLPTAEPLIFHSWATCCH